jgi:hypothetical protein
MVFWATVVVVVALVGYPLSAGPVSWLAAHEAIPNWSNATLLRLYAPLSWVTQDFPQSSAWYARLWFWYIDLWSGSGDR